MRGASLLLLALLATAGVAGACGRSELLVPWEGDGGVDAESSGDGTTPSGDATEKAGQDAMLPDASARETAMADVAAAETAMADVAAAETASDARVVDAGVPATALRGVTAISAGNGFACALLSGGTVECWGTGTYGQLGDGTSTSSSTAVAVSGLSGVTAISAGTHFACALLSGGSVECWGQMIYGELADGSTTYGCGAPPCSPTPVAIQGLSGVTAIAAGAQFACALRSDRTVQCWGDNTDGALGNGAAVGSSTPVTVPGLSGVTAISAGKYEPFVCALLSGGTVRCWGRNYLGELGNGTMTSASTPVPVSGLSGVTAIAADEIFACALLRDGTARCWGANNNGALGSGTMTGPQTCGYNACSLTPVAVSGLSGATALSAGGPCALLPGGTAECWGNNYYGQIGDGTTTSSATPVAVSGLSGVTALSSSAAFTCALLSAGTVECWGINADGALGNGTTPNALTPTYVVQ
jgi:alpha-tubulin suppressor-like RCC1 family protein